MGIFRSDNEVPCHSSITIDRATRCDWKLWTSTSVLCCYFLLWSKVVLGPLTTFEFLAFFDFRRWFWKRNRKKVLVDRWSLGITVLQISSLNGGVCWIRGQKRGCWLFVGTRRYPTRRTSVLSKHPSHMTPESILIIPFGMVAKMASNSTSVSNSQTSHSLPQPWWLLMIISW